jgi:transglutaminase-like putative cysteine protease
MAFVPRIVLSLFLLVSWATAQESARFRIWMAGQEVGGREVMRSRSGTLERHETREWIRLERLGMAVEQKVSQTATRTPGGILEFAWSLQLAQEPMEGRATWTPAEPRRLRVLSKNLPERMVELEEGLLLWPGDQEARLREAARTRSSLSIRGFLPALQQATELELRAVGVDPLPGFPDAVRFKGQSREGAMRSETELWYSPTAGEVKESSQVGGLSILVQRAELSAPEGPEPREGLFARTLNTLPPHPFLPWITEATLRWEGTGEQRLPEDEQQKNLGTGRIRVVRAALPTPQEAAQAPVKEGQREGPLLGPSPLLQFHDPAFEGLLARLRAPAKASRWELARRVNRFVFDWIAEKDYTVGFASALEVAHTPRGDCTEHGVLAVALLRRLGVPARGALGWIGTGGVMGLHFWVEVEIGKRWIPIDPTFDEAPASALHLKLGTTDLADLGSVGWDTAITRFAGGKWVPEGAWAKGTRILGERVVAPSGEGLQLPGARWVLEEGQLSLVWRGSHAVEAVPHPSQIQLQGAKVLQGPSKGRRAWLLEPAKALWVRLEAGRWLRCSDMDAQAAIAFLDQLELLPGR